MRFGDAVFKRYWLRCAFLSGGGNGDEQSRKRGWSEA
jgi:hypothetical protein